LAIDDIFQRLEKQYEEYQKKKKEKKIGNKGETDEL